MQGTSDANRSAKTALALILGEGLPERPEALAGSIDEITALDPWTGSPEVATTAIVAGSTIMVRGWAADLIARAPCAGVRITVGGMHVEAEYGQVRDDIANVYNDPAMRFTGYTAVLALSPTMRGHQHVSAVCVDASARFQASLGGERNIAIVGASLHSTISLAQHDAGAEISIDHVNSDGAVLPVNVPVTLEAGALLEVHGWARDIDGAAGTNGVYAIIDDTECIRGRARGPRQDVAKNYGESFLRAGFAVRIDTFGLTLGRHLIRIAAVSADGTRFAIGGPHIIIDVTPASS